MKRYKYFTAIGLLLALVAAPLALSQAATDRWTVNPTAPARHAETLTIDQDRTLTYNSLAIRNGSDSAVNVKVRFSDTQLDFTYRNIQPGATEVCKIDKIYDTGTTATDVDVIY